MLCPTQVREHHALLSDANPLQIVEFRSVEWQLNIVNLSYKYSCEWIEKERGKEREELHSYTINMLKLTVDAL